MTITDERAPGWSALMEQLWAREYAAEASIEREIDGRFIVTIPSRTLFRGDTPAEAVQGALDSLDKQAALAEAVDIPEGWTPIPGSPEHGHRRTDGAELWRWEPAGWFARTAGGLRTREGCETHTDALEGLDRLDKAERGEP